MANRFYEVQIARIVRNGLSVIWSTVTSPVIAKNKRDAWKEFCKRKQWPLNHTPSQHTWTKTVTEVDAATWEYLCACFYEERNNHG